MIVLLFARACFGDLFSASPSRRGQVKIPLFVVPPKVLVSARSIAPIEDRARGQEWQNIELRECVIVSDEAMSFSQSTKLKAWRAEHLSLSTRGDELRGWGERTRTHTTSMTA
jgi:hypothetical protein